MGELCLSSTSKPQFPSLILSDFALFCSFILFHPLYFLYFIFLILTLPSQTPLFSLSSEAAKDSTNTSDCNNGGEYTTEKVMLHTKPLVDGNVDNQGEYTWNLESWPNLGTNIGSMRKEKEWRRTLACKLFEERHNEGDEGIDSLWETYESKEDLSELKRMANTKKSSKKDYYGAEIEDDEEEFEMTNGQLCCLQAFKFSAGKMNLGMGRPNLVRISKALKRIGWLHNVKRHGNGKEERF